MFQRRVEILEKGVPNTKIVQIKEILLNLLLNSISFHLVSLIFVGFKNETVTNFIRKLAQTLDLPKNTANIADVSLNCFCLFAVTLYNFSKLRFCRTEKYVYDNEKTCNCVRFVTFQINYSVTILENILVLQLAARLKSFQNK